MTLDAELKLKQKYIQNLPAKMAEIELYFDDKNIDKLQVAIHKLAGSAGMYGFSELSLMAADIEDFIVSKETVDRLMLETQLQRLYGRVSRLIQ